MGPRSCGITTRWLDCCLEACFIFCVLHTTTTVFTTGSQPAKVVVQPRGSWHGYLGSKKNGVLWGRKYIGEIFAEVIVHIYDHSHTTLHREGIMLDKNWLQIFKELVQLSNCWNFWLVGLVFKERSSFKNCKMLNKHCTNNLIELMLISHALSRGRQ